MDASEEKRKSPRGGFRPLTGDLSNSGRRTALDGPSAPRAAGRIDRDGRPAVRTRTEAGQAACSASRGWACRLCRRAPIGAGSCEDAEPGGGLHLTDWVHSLGRPGGDRRGRRAGPTKENSPDPVQSGEGLHRFPACGAKRCRRAGPPGFHQKASLTDSSMQKGRLSQDLGNREARTLAPGAIQGRAPAPGPNAVAAPGAAEASKLASDRDDVADDVSGVSLGEQAGIALIAPFEGRRQALAIGGNDQGGSNVESVL